MFLKKGVRLSGKNSDDEKRYAKTDGVREEQGKRGNGIGCRQSDNRPECRADARRPSRRESKTEKKRRHEFRPMAFGVNPHRVGPLKKSDMEKSCEIKPEDNDDGAAYI